MELPTAPMRSEISLTADAWLTGVHQGDPSFRVIFERVGISGRSDRSFPSRTVRYKALT